MAGNNGIQLLRGNSAQRANSNQTLLPGQPFYETDTTRLYIGTGANGVALNEATPVMSWIDVNAGGFASANTPYSIAIGREANVTGQTDGLFFNDKATIAIGYRVNANGNTALAIGYLANAAASDSIAIGNNATADDQRDISIGWHASTLWGTSTDKIAIGSSAEARGSMAIAIGDDSFGNGYWSVAIGASAKAHNSSSIAIGHYAKTSEEAENSIVIGANAVTSTANTIVLGDASIQHLRCQKTSIESLSDERVKANITFANTSLCLEDVNRLPVKRFEFKKFASPNQIDKHVTGFIAQDTEKVFPKSVSIEDREFSEYDEEGNEVRIPVLDEEGNQVFEEDGITPKTEAKKFKIEDVRSMDTAFGIPTLWGAVQELTKITKAQREKIDELEERIKKLEK